MEKHKQRLNEIATILEADKIDLERLKCICFQYGCPNEGSSRSLIWKLLLNYLPLERPKWNESLNKSRCAYKEFVREMIIRPGCNSNANSNQQVHIDHPLAIGKESEWDGYFKDNQILLQIDKDVRRLCPDLFFFQRPTEFPCDDIKNIENAERYQSLRKRVASSQLKSDEISKNRLGFTNVKSIIRKSDLDDSEYSHLEDGEAHWEVVERILYIFAKLNTGNSYVQGMNEIIGPIYYIFANDPSIEWRQWAEADTFYCFTNLMGLEGVRENFVKELDDSQWGIGSNMKKLYELVKIKDPLVYNVLERQCLKPEFFAFRWLSLLLSQEFQLPDVISLWDCLFSDNKLFDLLMYICCSMIIIQRDALLNGDFSANIKILQSYPPGVDIQLILSFAKKLRANK